MKDLKLNLNVNEVNSILRALSNLPYSQVHQLIDKIQSQAREQLNEGNGVTHHVNDEHTSN